MAQSSVIWTIGHSNHDFETLICLLRGERIEFVVDVRSFPYSRFAPQFGRQEIERGLEQKGVRYLFMGSELGGRPSRSEQYDSEGHALYGRMAAEPDFRKAISRLVQGATKHRIALLCSEGLPQDCHRRLLVGKVLAEEGLTLRHVLPDATVVEEVEVRLGEVSDQAPLFGDAPLVWRSTQSVSRRRRLSTSSAV